MVLETHRFLWPNEDVVGGRGCYSRMLRDRSPGQASDALDQWVQGPAPVGH